MTSDRILFFLLALTAAFVLTALLVEAVLGKTRPVSFKIAALLWGAVLAYYLAAYWISP